MRRTYFEKNIQLNQLKQMNRTTYVYTDVVHFLSISIWENFVKNVLLNTVYLTKVALFLCRKYIYTSWRGPARAFSVSNARSVLSVRPDRPKNTFPTKKSILQKLLKNSAEVI